MRVGVALGLLVLFVGAAGGACRREPADGADAGAEFCDFAGKRHREGDSFPDADGCNLCFCETAGSVVCTLALCELDPRLGRGYR